MSDLVDSNSGGTMDETWRRPGRRRAGFAVSAPELYRLDHSAHRRRCHPGISARQVSPSLTRSPFVLPRSLDLDDIRVGARSSDWAPGQPCEDWHASRTTTRR